MPDPVNGLDLSSIITDGTTPANRATMEAVGEAIIDETLSRAPAPNAALTAENGSGTDTTTDAVASEPIASILQTVWGKIRQVVNALTAANERITHVENLGDYVGASDTYALLGKHTSDFPQGISVNDFATIRADETQNGATTRYVVSSIDTNGDITWTYDLVYLISISGVLEKAIPLTYADLTTKINNSELVQGQKYLITDFQTIYIQPVTTTIMSGSVEPLLVTALDTNKLEPIAFSPSNPYDVIYYDPTQNNTARYEWATSDDKGQIYRRITKNNNDIPYDLRTIRFRRYQVSDTITAWSSGTAYAKGDVITHSSNVYIATKPSTTVTPNSNAYDTWKLLCPTTGNDSYISLATSGLLVYIGSSSYTVPVSSLNYKDFYTFDNGNEVNQVDNGSVYNNVTAPYMGNGFQRLNNSAFIGTNFYNNTIATNFYNNTIATYFQNNTIATNFQNNTIGTNFQSNTIGNSFSNNTIATYFQNNTIGDDFFFYNRFGDCFKYNKLAGYGSSNQDIFRYNEFGNGIQFSSLKDWGTGGISQFKSEYTVQVMKSQTGKIRAYYYDNNDTFVSVTIVS